MSGSGDTPGGDAPKGETPKDDTPGREARLLLRAARAGTLATQVDGQPFASLVTPATAPDGSVLMLLSGLSEHTRHLKADPRCAVMVVGEPGGPNAQTAPRATLTGQAAPEPDPLMKARWIALHPYAAFYADLPDFVLWRMRPQAGQFIGGFARAFRLRRDDLAPDAAAVAAVAEAEAEVIAHCNADHPDALAAIAHGHGHGHGEGGEDWRMAACDADGFDLARAETVRRIAWDEPVDGPGAIRRALIRLARDARQRGPGGAGRAGEQQL